MSALCLLVSVQLSSSEISSWSSPPTPISSEKVNASDPRIGMDASANAVAIWIEGGVVMSSTLPSGGSWTAIETVSATGASTPQLVVDPSGNATAVWVESGIVKAASLPFGGSWSSSTSLSADGSSLPQIGVRDNGDVVAVWVTSGAIHSSTKLNGGSWQVLADTLALEGADVPQVAIGSDGTVLAVWHTLNGVTSIYNITAATKSIGGLWSAASTVSDPTVNSVYPHVAVDINGNATAIWFIYDLKGSTYFNVFLYASALPSSGSAWSKPVAISLDPSVRDPADLTACILYGTASFPTVLWTAFYDGATFWIESSQNLNNQGWTEASTIANGTYDFALGMTATAQNDVFGIYMSDDGSAFINIQSANSHIGGSQGGFWFNPTTISSGVTNAYPQIAGVITGGTTNNVAAVWLNYDGENNIVQAVTGTGTLVEPPSDLLVTQEVNDFKLFQEYFNTVTWTASVNPNIVAYAIYRNDIFLTTVDAGTFEFVESNTKQDGAVTYGVSALDSAGSESAVISVSFP